MSWWQDEKSFAIKNTNSRIKTLTAYNFEFLFWRTTNWAFISNFFTRDIATNLANMIGFDFIPNDMIDGAFI